MLYDYFSSFIQSDTLFSGAVFAVAVVIKSNRELKQGRSEMAPTTPENNDRIAWMREDNRAARTLIEFFDVVCQMTTWNNDTVNNQL